MSSPENSTAEKTDDAGTSVRALMPGRPPPDPVLQAAGTGDLAALKQLHADGHAFCLWAINEAVSRGHLDCVRFMHENGCAIDPKGYLLTISMNDAKEILVYFVDDLGFELTTNVSATAAYFGAMECLRFMHARGCIWDETVMECAARHSDLEVIKYLRENGCPWNETVTAAAARRWDAEVLRYLHENGCPWDETARKAAAVVGYVAALEYLNAHGCPGKEEEEEVGDVDETMTMNFLQQRRSD